MHPNNGSASTILVVDGDGSLGTSFLAGLSQAGYRVIVARNGEDALSKASLEHPEVILLDVPGLSAPALEMCKALHRQHQPNIIILAPESSGADVIAGLECGADDYLTEPFGPDLLLAHIHAVLRRRQRAPGDSAGTGWLPSMDVRITLGPLDINIHTHEVSCHGKPVELGRRLFDVLVFLARREGEVVTREDLLSEVWGYQVAGRTRTVDVHMHWLRKSLARTGCKGMIQTIRGAGYRMVLRKAV